MGVKDSQPLAGQGQCAAVGGDDAGDKLGQLGLSVAVHTGDTHDLPAVHRQGHIVQSVMLGLLMIIHMGQLHRDLRVGAVLLLVLGGDQFAADHHAGQLLAVGVGTVDGAYHLTQPQHGDTIGDVHDLAHLVADKDDALALGHQLAHDGEQALHLDVRQSGGRLVQNQQFRAVIQCLQDLGALLLAHGDLRDEPIQLYVQTVSGGQLLDLLAAGGPIDKQPLGVLVTQDNVVEHRHRFHQHEVLVYHADAQLHRLAGGLDADLLPLQKDLALCGLVQTNQDIHQRRLARAVFAQQRQHLAAIDGQADVFFGVEAAKPFADMLHSQQLTQFSSLPASPKLTVSLLYRL